MFDKMKDLYNLKKHADSMKKEMAKIMVEYEDKGIKVLVRGDQHIEQLEVDGVEDKRLKDVLNNAMKETQKKVAKKMQGQLSDLGIPGL
ncbi:YbaB/EbfC family nucleoid-associated protein [candidate division WWE3 bacterium]|nr:YbaB/EbfC family nucleoid-associated protein [candidate division WWE3 bacterium]